MRSASRNTLLGETGFWAGCCAAIAITVSAVGVRAAETVSSNLDLMTALTADVAAELYQKFAPSLGGRSLELKPFAGSEDYVFVGNILTTELTRSGVDVTLSAANAPVRRSAGADSLTAPDPAGNPVDVSQGGLVLQFQNIAFQVAYPDVYRSHLVGGKKVRRTASVRVFATLTDAASGRVLWTGEAERSRADEFDKDDAARIEYGTYAFVRPAEPSGGWGKYVEPVFVTGIVVGLIYLFFSNQSGN